MFSVLTRPNYPKAAIGIERDRVTVVSLERSGRGRFGVRQAAAIELPAGVVEPSFTGRNIADARQFRVVLEDAAASAGLLNQRSWSVSLPSNSARSAILTLEGSAASRNETEEILDWKAEQAFGAPAGQLRISRIKIPGDAEGRVRYFATAVTLAVIDEYETVFEEMGWRAGLILPRAVSESKWLLNEDTQSDSLLVSVQEDGFTAFLLHNGEPNVVRTVTCTPAERDDELYRLLMFYHDRFAGSGGELSKFLVVGRDIEPGRINDISAEALGRSLSILRADDVGLMLPVGTGLAFEDLAAPAGLATLGWN